MKRALDNGKDEIRGMVTHLAFYAGWPTAVNAGRIAVEVFDEDWRWGLSAYRRTPSGALVPDSRCRFEGGRRGSVERDSRRLPRQACPVFLDRQAEGAAAGTQFGQPDYYPFIEGLPEPYVIPLIKEADGQELR